MEPKKSNTIPSIIIGASIIIAAVIYAYSNRYSNDGYVIIDKWKQEIIKPKVR